MLNRDSTACYDGEVRVAFVDSDPDVAEALASAFARFPEVSVRCGDLLAAAEHAVVSPANSQGYMDGGFDRALVAYFGASLERRVRDAIAARPEGYLPIGASVAIETGHARVPYLIVAPTMLSPEFVEAQNAYRAMRAILRVAPQLPEAHRTIYCPGLCTGVGGVEPTAAAAEMATAYWDWSRSGAL